MNYMYGWGRSNIGEWKPLLIEDEAASGVTLTATPTVGPVAVFRATWNIRTDTSVMPALTCNYSGTFTSGLGGLSLVDQPPLRAVFTRPEVEVYTLRRKGDLEGA